MPRLIDADALLSGFDVRKVVEYDESGCGVDYKAVPVEAIANAPTIDAEPVRHGRWDENGRCTNCGGHAPYWAMATTYYKSPYCFECGAKMTEVSKEV